MDLVERPVGVVLKSQNILKALYVMYWERTIIFLVARWQERVSSLIKRVFGFSMKHSVSPLPELLLNAVFYGRIKNGGFRGVVAFSVSNCLYINELDLEMRKLRYIFVAKNFKIT